MNPNFGSEQIQRKEKRLQEIDSELAQLYEWLRQGYGPLGDAEQMKKMISSLETEANQISAELEQIKAENTFASESKALLDELADPVKPTTAEAVARWVVSIQGLNSINQAKAWAELRIRMAKEANARPDFVKELKAVGVPPELYADLITTTAEAEVDTAQIQEEQRKKELNDRISSLIVSISPAFYSELKSILDTGGLDNAMQKKLKEKIGAFYRAIEDPVKRDQFVRLGRLSQIPESVIGEYLWQQTQESLKAQESVIEEGRKLMKVKIDEAIALKTDPSVLWRDSVLPYLREKLLVGLPMEAERQLRNDFIEAVMVGGERDQKSLALNVLTRRLVDGAISGLSQDRRSGGLGIYDPQRGGRNPYPAELTENGRLNLGALERAVRDEVVGMRIAMPDNPQHEQIVSSVMEAVAAQVDVELKEINELQKKIRELDAKQRELNRLLWDERMNSASNLLKVGGGLVVGGTIAGIMLFNNIPLTSISLANVLFEQHPFRTAGFSAGLGMFGLGSLLPKLREGIEKSREKKIKIEEQRSDIGYLEAEVARLEAKTGFGRTKRTEQTRSWIDQQLRGMGPDVLDSRVQEFMRQGTKPLQFATMSI